MIAFERGVQITAIQAKQDKIAIVFGKWIFDTSFTQIEALASYMSRRTWHSINGEQYEFTPLRDHQRRTNRWKIPFRSHQRNGAVQEGAALIAGEIVIQQTGFNNFGPSRYYCTADVAINPTRALAYQSPTPSIVGAFRSGDHSNASVWSAPIGWSGLIVSASWASGPLGRCFPARADDSPMNYAA